MRKNQKIKLTKSSLQLRNKNQDSTVSWKPHKKYVTLKAGDVAGLVLLEQVK